MMKLEFLLKASFASLLILLMCVFAACGDPDKGGDEPGGEVTDPIDQYTVNFYNGEELVKSVVVEENKTVELPEVPVKNGYNFNGWFYEEEGNQKELTDSTPIKGDYNAYAQWSEFVFEYEFIDILFMIDGERYKEMSLEAGDPVSQLSFYKAEKYGYEFVGWFAGDIMIYDGYIPKENMTVHAKFEPLGTIFTVTIDGKTREFLEGDVYALPNANKKGYKLIGYADGEKIVTKGEIVVDKDYEFTSVWVAAGTENKEYALTLTESQTYKKLYGEIIILPNTFKFGYIFKGWTDGTNIYNKGFQYVLYNNVTLTPVFEEIQGGDSQSNLAYTIYNLDLFYDNIVFPIKENINLPVKDSVTNAEIVWESSNPEILSEKGVVTRIMHKDRNIEVKMTATIKIDNIVETREYEFYVKQQYKDLSKGVAAGYFYPSEGISDFGLDTLDILNCAFLYFDNQGRITGGEGYANSLASFIERAHARGDRVIASIGAQGTNTIQYIKTISESPALIENFAENLLQYVIDTKLDGIDMDWETPGSSHAKNYTKLMKVIYEKFKAYDDELLITSAIGAGPWQYKYYDLVNSNKYHDYINMMSYDMQSSSVSTFQSALYPSSQGRCLTVDCSVSRTVGLYNSVGITNDRIIIGIPFYGRKFSASEGAGKAGSASGAVNQSTINSYLYKNGEYVSGIEFWDDECKVPYIYIASEKLFVSYENPRSIQEKMKFVGEQNLAGVMFWQNGQDYKEMLMTAINQNKKLME